MFAIQQDRMAAPAILRTSERKVVGQQRPKSGKVMPAQWVDWTLGGPVLTDATFRVAAERLRNAAMLKSGDRVLNVMAGTANAHRLGEAILPFRNAAFDIVLTGFGAIYAASSWKMAQELLRVCRRSGRIGLACWTPESFDGRLISIIDRYVPANEASDSPAWWGTREYLDALFGRSADALGALDRTHTWRFGSPAAWLEASRAHGGQLHDLYQAVDPDWHDQLTAELLALVHDFNEASDGSMVVQSHYLEFVVHKSTWRT